MTDYRLCLMTCRYCWCKSISASLNMLFSSFHQKGFGKFFYKVPYVLHKVNFFLFFNISGCRNGQLFCNKIVVNAVIIQHCATYNFQDFVIILLCF